MLPCLRPYPAEAMDGYPVTPLVSSVRNDGPELVRPLNSAWALAGGRGSLPRPRPPARRDVGRLRGAA